MKHDDARVHDQDPLVLSALGPFHATYRHQPLTFATKAARALLAYLASEPDRAHSRDRLAGLLWPDAAQTVAATNLRQTVARVRKAIPVDWQGLTVTRQTLALRSEAADIDVFAFEDLIAECAVHDHERASRCRPCIERLEQAVDRYRGEFLESLFFEHSQPLEEWVLVRRERLRGQVLDALETLTDAYAARSDHERALDRARRQLGIEPWRELAHRQVMRTLAATGDRTGALAQYLQCRKVLAAELDVAPEPATTALDARIRAGEALDQTEVSVLIGDEWSDVPEVGRFHGRSTELATLRRWIVDDRSRLVSIVGMGGIGKTTLAAAAAREVAPDFDVVVWRSLLNAPSLNVLLAGILPTLTGHRLGTVPFELEAQMSTTLEMLRERRCLLVLDNVESVLDGPTGGWRPGYDRYGELLRRFVQTRHASCVIVTSRERGSWPGEDDTGSARSLPLGSMGVEAGRAMLAERGLTGTPAELAAVIERYSGNPLALRLVGETVQDLFVGDLGSFIATEVSVFDDIASVLDEQYARLSTLEQEILCWLALHREPMSIATLGEKLVEPVRPRRLMEALRALQRRSLLQHGAPLTCPHVVLEHVTDRLVDELADALVEHRLEPLNRYGLLDPHAAEHVRTSQIRLVVTPVVERLVDATGRPAAAEALQRLLAGVRRRLSGRNGYAAGNIVNLALHMEVDVRGWDLSGVSVWQADLRGALLTDVDLRAADIRRSAFSDKFGTTRSLAVSRDGQWIAAGSIDRPEVRVWRAADGALSTVLVGHHAQVLTVAFAPDGHTIATGSADDSVRVWDLTSGEGRQAFEGHGGSVWSVAFDPTDANTLATAGKDAVVRLWDLTSGTCRTLPGHTEWIWSVAFSPDGRTLASGGRDRVVRLWDVRAGRTTAELHGHDDTVIAVTFSPDGHHVASCSTDRSVRVWNVATGALAAHLGDFEGMVWSLDFHPDGSDLAVASAEPTIRIWDTNDWQPHRTLAGHPSGVHSVRYDGDGRGLISAGWDQAIRRWDPGTGRCMAVRRGHEPGVYSVAFAPDGRTVASGHFDRRVRLWDVRTGGVGATLPAQDDVVMSIAVDPTGTHLASASGAEIRTWDLVRSRPGPSFRVPGPRISAIAFDPTDALLAGAVNNDVHVWDAHHGHERMILHGHTDWIPSVAFQPCPGPRSPVPHLATASIDRTIRLWDARTFELLDVLDVGSECGWIRSVAFGPDGSTFATGGQDGIVRLWDVETREVQRELHGHHEGINAVVYSADGAFLASGGIDQTIHVWDVDRGAERHVLRGHDAWVWSLAFHPCPGEPLLASASSDGTVRLWDAATGSSVGTLRTEDPYARMDVTGVTGITAEQRATLMALGAIDTTDRPPVG